MKISKIWFDNNRIYGLTDDGRTLWQSLLYYRRLQHATPEQREDYEMDDEGIHWYQLDEDVSFESFEYDDPEPTGVSLVFLSHPELNAAAVGRRLGISQSLMAQYINGNMINNLQSCKERFSTCILKMVYLKLNPQSNPKVDEVLHLNDLIRMFANTENPLWGMASDESVATRIEIMYAYSPK